MFPSLLWEVEASGCILCLHKATILSRTFPAQTTVYRSGNASCLCSVFIQKRQKTWPGFFILPLSQLADEGLRSPWVKLRSHLRHSGLGDRSSRALEVQMGKGEPTTHTDTALHTLTPNLYPLWSEAHQLRLLMGVLESLGSVPFMPLLVSISH